MSATHPIGVAENFFKFKADNSVELDLQPLKEIFEHPEVKDRKIVVLSVVGAFRQGKSFFLGYCLRFLYATYKSIKRPANVALHPDAWMGEETDPLLGFSWRTGVARDTSGMLIWNDVFLHENEKKEKLAIVVIDTQGLFDNITVAASNSKIFALSTLISSIQVFNSSGIVQENQIKELHFAAEFASFTQNTNSTGKSFQTLMFLLRNWTMTISHKYGFEGGRAYIQSVLNTHTGQDEELRSVRERLRDTFETINCSLIPLPGSTVATGLTRSGEKYDGNYGAMDPDFKQHFFEAIEHLLKPKNLVCKKIDGNEMTGVKYLEMLTLYLELFQSDAIPKVDTVFESTVKMQLTGVKNACLSKYKENMEAAKASITDERQIAQINNGCKAKALSIFQAEKKMGSQRHADEFRILLQDEIADYYENWRIQVETRLKEERERKLKEDNENWERFVTACFEEYKKAVEEREEEVNEFTKIMEIQRDSAKLLQTKYKTERVNYNLELEMKFRLELTINVNNFNQTWRQKMESKVRAEKEEQQRKQLEEKNEWTKLVESCFKKYKLKVLEKLETLIEERQIAELHTEAKDHAFEAYETEKEQRQAEFELTSRELLEGKINENFIGWKTSTEFKLRASEKEKEVRDMQHREAWRNHVLSTLAAYNQEVNLHVDSIKVHSDIEAIHESAKNKAQEYFRMQDEAQRDFKFEEEFERDLNLKIESSYRIWRQTQEKKLKNSEDQENWEKFVTACFEEYKKAIEEREGEVQEFRKVSEILRDATILLQTKYKTERVNYNLEFESKFKLDLTNNVNSFNQTWRQDMESKARDKMEEQQRKQLQEVNEWTKLIESCLKKYKTELVEKGESLNEAHQITTFHMEAKDRAIEAYQTEKEQRQAEFESNSREQLEGKIDEYFNYWKITMEFKLKASEQEKEAKNAQHRHAWGNHVVSALSVYTQEVTKNVESVKKQSDITTVHEYAKTKALQHFKNRDEERMDFKFEAEFELDLNSRIETSYNTWRRSQELVIKNAEENDNSFWRSLVATSVKKYQGEVDQKKRKCKTSDAIMTLHNSAQKIAFEKFETESNKATHYANYNTRKIEAENDLDDKIKEMYKQWRAEIEGKIRTRNERIKELENKKTLSYNGEWVHWSASNSGVPDNAVRYENNNTYVARMEINKVFHAGSYDPSEDRAHFYSNSDGAWNAGTFQMLRHINYKFSDHKVGYHNAVLVDPSASENEYIGYCEREPKHKCVGGIVDDYIYLARPNWHEWYGKGFYVMKRTDLTLDAKLYSQIAELRNQDLP